MSTLLYSIGMSGSRVLACFDVLRLMLLHESSEECISTRLFKRASWSVNVRLLKLLIYAQNASEKKSVKIAGGGRRHQGRFAPSPTAAATTASA
jgi:hypothetical protein